jgi:hypothetical protein
MPLSWTIVRFSVNLWEDHFAIFILIPELKILVACEIHDHEDTTSSQSTAPVPTLSENCVQGNGTHLRNLSIFRPIINDDTIIDILILQGELEPVDGKSCTTQMERPILRWWGEKERERWAYHERYRYIGHVIENSLRNGTDIQCIDVLCRSSKFTIGTIVLCGQWISASSDIGG